MTEVSNSTYQIYIIIKADFLVAEWSPLLLLCEGLVALLRMNHENGIYYCLMLTLGIFTLVCMVFSRSYLETYTNADFKEMPRRYRTRLEAFGWDELLIAMHQNTTIHYL